MAAAVSRRYADRPMHYWTHLFAKMQKQRMEEKKTDGQIHSIKTIVCKHYSTTTTLKTINTVNLHLLTYTARLQPRQHAHRHSWVQLVSQCSLQNLLQNFEKNCACWICKFLSKTWSFNVIAEIDGQFRRQTVVELLLQFSIYVTWFVNECQHIWRVIISNRAMRCRDS